VHVSRCCWPALRGPVQRESMLVTPRRQEDCQNHACQHRPGWSACGAPRQQAPRRGRQDALAKTVPIWAAVLNRAVAAHRARAASAPVPCAAPSLARQGGGALVPDPRSLLAGEDGRAARRGDSAETPLEPAAACCAYGAAAGESACSGPCTGAGDNGGAAEVAHDRAQSAALPAAEQRAAQDAAEHTLAWLAGGGDGRGVPSGRQEAACPAAHDAAAPGRAAGQEAAVRGHAGPGAGALEAAGPAAAARAPAGLAASAPDPAGQAEPPACSLAGSGAVVCEPGAGAASEWDAALHLPPWVSATECSQIEQRLDGFVHELLQVGPIGELRVLPIKPLHGLWGLQSSA